MLALDVQLLRNPNFVEKNPRQDELVVFDFLISLDEVTSMKESIQHIQKN